MQDHAAFAPVENMVSCGEVNVMWPESALQVVAHTDSLQLHQISDYNRRSVLQEDVLLPQIPHSNKRRTGYDRNMPAIALAASASLYHTKVMISLRMETRRFPPNRFSLIHTFSVILAASFRRIFHSDLPAAVHDVVSPHCLIPLDICSDEHAMKWYDIENKILDKLCAPSQASVLDMAVSLFQKAVQFTKLNPGQGSPLPTHSSCLGRLLRMNVLLLILRFICTGSVTVKDLDMAIEVGREVLSMQLQPVASRIDLLHLLGLALSQRCKLTGSYRDTDEAVSLRREMLQLLPASHPNRSCTLNNLAIVLRTRFKQRGSDVDLHEAAGLHQEAITISPLHPHRSSHLYNLATTLHTRFERMGSYMDLEESVRFHREALKLRLSPHPERPNSLVSLVYALWTRFQWTELHIDLDEAIRLLREVLELRPVPHTQRSCSLNCLASALWTRFERIGSPIDLDEAIRLHREALGLPAQRAHKQSSLNDLASALQARFQRTRSLVDLDEAIRLYQEVELRPALYPTRSCPLNNLLTRFKWISSHFDLDEAIRLHREGLEQQPSHRLCLLNNLALNLQARFERTGSHFDLEEAIRLHQEMLRLPSAPYPHRSGSLNNLAMALKIQFEWTGSHVHLDEAIRLHREALGLRSAPHPYRSCSLNNLANALLTRFEWTGSHFDLDEAIWLQREGLKLRLAPHHHMSGLANALHARFEWTGSHIDLEEAIWLYREELELQPAPHPRRSCSLINLASTLRARFEWSGSYIDLGEAIQLHREALELPAYNHDHKSILFNNLATALRTRFETTGSHLDLDEAIRLHREALLLLPSPHPNITNSLSHRAHKSDPGNPFTTLELSHVDLVNTVGLIQKQLEPFPIPQHPSRPAILYYLAFSLQTQFHQSGIPVYLDEAVELLCEAIGLPSASHAHDVSWPKQVQVPNVPTKRISQTSWVKAAMEACHESIIKYPLNCPFLERLARIILDMYSHSGQSEYIDAAVACFRAAVACSSAPSSERFRAAESWAHSLESKHASALEGYEHAIRLLPRLAMLGLNLRSRRQALKSRSNGLACRAAACAVQSGKFTHAVELLETGRGIFWSQALRVRTPLDMLRLSGQQGLDLARKLECISRILDRGSLREATRQLSDASEKVMFLEQEAIRYRKLDEDWLSTVEEIRRLDGFQDFLRPKPMATLQAAASKGPVVILNASESACTAFVVSSSGVHHIPLPDFTIQHAEVLYNLVQTGLSHNAQSSIVEHFVQQLRILSPSNEVILADQERHLRPAVDTTVRSNDVFRIILGTIWKSVTEPVIRFLELEVRYRKKIKWH